MRRYCNETRFDCWKNKKRVDSREIPAKRLLAFAERTACGRADEWGVQMKRGLIVGRFQPYHIGHHNAIRKILAKVDELIIVIGSAKQSHEQKNPFTAGERIEMISQALKEEGIFEKCYIIPVEDVQENSIWTTKIIAYCPKFDVVFTNNPLVKQLFEGARFKTEKMVSEQKDIDGAKIREMMLKGNEWKKLVPKQTVAYLDKIKALDRIRAVYAKEQKE